MQNQECLSSFNIFIGDDISQLLGVELNGDPVDISSATEIAVTFSNDPNFNPPSPTYTAKLSTSQISITDGPLGKLTLTLASAVTALFLAQTGYNVDIVVTIAAKTTTYRIPNGANIIQRAPSP